MLWPLVLIVLGSTFYARSPDLLLPTVKLADITLPHGFDELPEALPRTRHANVFTRHADLPRRASQAKNRQRWARQRACGARR